MTTEQQGQKTEAEQQDGDRELFGDDDLQSFRARWEQVQNEFVDEPRETVQKADDLVSDLVERLTSSFADARSGLEEQWKKGEEASTEDLRVALTRYRAFFQRLLKV
jgi:Lon protease-like protein